MITDATLADVRDKLMDAMTLLYLDDKDDEYAQDLAGLMIMIHESIEVELVERVIP